MWFLVIITNSLLFGNTAAFDGLSVDPQQVSVSGVFGGAAMASQYHVSHSAKLMGLGMFDGFPYFCANNSIEQGFGPCLFLPDTIDTAALIGQAEAWSGEKVDYTKHMAADKVYIYHGSVDPFILPGASKNSEEFYQYFKADIKTEYTIKGGHAFPTVDKGNPCSVSLPPFIGKCKYNGALQMLTHIYGPLNEPTSLMKENLLEFDQSQFPPASNMDEIGYIYIPSACKEADQVCTLHVALHGCTQGRDTIGDKFVRNTGYLEVAEANNMVILFPQVKTSVFPVNNPLGCWDFWGYSGGKDGEYATKEGAQIKAIDAMVNWLIKAS